MSILRTVFETLNDYYEHKPPIAWWSDDPLEVIVGAVLVQASTWKSVEKVLQRFRELKLLDFQKIAESNEEALTEIVRPVGFATRRVKYLKAVSQLFLDKSGGNTAAFFARDLNLVRKELLAVPGIGAGTADNILLYAGNLPVYMVDPFTRRILFRHGIVSSLAKDSEIQALIHRELTPDEEPYGTKLYSKLQEYVVRIGREFCGKTETDCVNCPLRSLLPNETKPAETEISVQKHAQPKTERKENTTSSAAALPPDINETERKIVEHLGGEPKPIDAVVEAVHLPVHIVRATIAVLEMKKMVKQTEGNQVKRV